MLRQGKPSQYIGAALAGLAASVIGGFILSMGFRGSILISLVFGLLVGEAVRRGARGNRGPAFMAIAAVTTLLGLLIVGYGLSLMGFVFALVIAGIAAYRISE
jgi:hypothetical protein